MKKTILIAVLFAATAKAEPTGNYLTWMGFNAGNYGNGNSSTMYGSYSGTMSDGMENSSFMGVMSGYQSRSLVDCFGFGFHALQDATWSSNVFAVGRNAGRGADYLDNCLFIGNGAGRDSKTLTNCVFIGRDAGRGASNLVDRTYINGQFYADRASDSFFIDPQPNRAATHAPMSYSNGTFRVYADHIIETTAGNRQAFETANADLWLSACDGSDENDGLAPARAVKTLAGAYNAAYNAATNGTLNISNKIIVAVAEGRYRAYDFASALSNGIAYVATGDRADTIIDGMMDLSGETASASALGGDLPVGNRLCCGGVIYSVSIRGFTVTRFNALYTGSTFARSQPIYGIEFLKCDFMGNDPVVDGSSAFASGKFEDCDFHGNRVRCRQDGSAAYAFFGGNSCTDDRTPLFGDDVVLSRCHVWDNDMSRCAYFISSHDYRLRRCTHCLFEVDFYISRRAYSPDSHHNTFIAKTISNPYVGGITEIPGDITFGTSPTNRNFIVLSEQPDTYADESVYGVGNSCVVSNANLTADFVAADASCPSVRDDGEEDYGWKSSGFGANKYATHLAGDVAGVVAVLNGETARYIVTNFNNVAEKAAAEVEVKINGEWQTVWKELTRWDWLIDEYLPTNYYTKAECDANFADRAWGAFDPTTGNLTPDGRLWLSAPSIYICAGASYERVANAAGEYWVLTANGMVADINGVSSNGFFRIADSDGVTHFEIVKGDRQTLAAVAGAMRSETVMGVLHHFTTYYVQGAAETPKARFARSLDKPVTWYDEDDASCPFNVSWTNPESGTFVCEWWPKATEPKGFMKAEYVRGGETYIKNTAPVSVAGGILCTDGIHKVRPVYSNGSVTWEVINP